MTKQKTKPCCNGYPYSITHNFGSLTTNGSICNICILYYKALLWYIPMHTHTLNTISSFWKNGFPGSIYSICICICSTCICNLFSMLLSPANETDIADISVAALCNGAIGNSGAIVKGTTLLGGRCYEGENVWPSPPHHYNVFFLLGRTGDSWIGG